MSMVESVGFVAATVIVFFLADSLEYSREYFNRKKIVINYKYEDNTTCRL